MVAEIGGLRWDITLPLNTEKSVVPADPKPAAPPSGARTIQSALVKPLRGKRFLIVEDEPLIALDIVASVVELVNRVSLRWARSGPVR